MAILSATLPAAARGTLLPVTLPALVPMPASSGGAAGVRARNAPRSLLATLTLLCATLMVALSCLAVGADAPAQNSVERGIKAAFLYKFLGYVEYPQESTPLVVGVLGADDIGAELVRITAGRNVGGRAVAVRVLHEGEALAGLHMLFVGADAGRSGALLRTAQQQGVLTVTETDNGLLQGGVINFRLVEERVRFEVSLPAAEKNGVKLSSRLLSVAYHVLKGSQ